MKIFRPLLYEWLLMPCKWGKWGVVTWVWWGISPRNRESRPLCPSICPFPALFSHFPEQDDQLLHRGVNRGFYTYIMGKIGQGVPYRVPHPWKSPSQHSVMGYVRFLYGWYRWQEQDTESREHRRPESQRSRTPPRAGKNLGVGVPFHRLVP